MGGKHVLKNSSKLQVSGQKIVCLLWEDMVRRAMGDTKMRNLPMKVNYINRRQTLNFIFSFVLSFVLLRGSNLSKVLAAVDQVWSLLDSTMSAVVGNQEAITPHILDKFVGSAA